MGSVEVITGHTRYPGEDIARRTEVENRLFEAFSPKDVLEEIWLLDVAALTSSVEYYRELEISKNREIAAQFAPTEAGDGQWVNYLEVENPFHIKRLIGSFDQDDIRALATIIEVTAKLRRERERVYAQFERKRRALLINAVDAVELNREQTIAIEALSD